MNETNESAPTRPNFVVFIADSMAASCLGCSGNRHIRTPNLDALAADGVNFLRAYCNSPVCMPSRAGLLTGRNRRNHGVLTNGTPLPRHVPTVAQALAEAGYRTHVVGQIHAQPSAVSGDDENGEPLSWESRADWKSGRITALPKPYYGFQTSDYIGSKGANCYGDYGNWLDEVAPEARQLYALQNAYFAREDSPSCWRMPIPRELHATEWAANKSIEFIESQSGEQPFLLWCGFFDPHAPYAACRPYSEMYEPSTLPLPETWQNTADPCHALHRKRQQAPYNTQLTQAGVQELTAQFYGMVTHIDECIGRVLTSLKAKGLYDNTVIVFMSDHGDYLGAHHLMYKGAWPYEEVLRVPMIWKGVGSTPHEAVQTPVSLLDFVPTLLDYAGISEEVLLPRRIGEAERPGLPGRSLRPAMEGRALESRPILAELDEDFSPGAMTRMRALITGNYKLAVFSQEGEGLLFVREGDPHELNNRWSDEEYREVRANLTHQLLEELIWTDRLDMPRPGSS